MKVKAVLVHNTWFSYWNNILRMFFSFPQLCGLSYQNVPSEGNVTPRFLDRVIFHRKKEKTLFNTEKSSDTAGGVGAGGEITSTG